jgi:Flp pilus assembly pilin Flp
VETLLLFKHLTGSLHSRLRGEAGQTMAEYAILLAVIALVVVAVAVFLGSSISSIFSSTSHKL